jgi:photosystem II stability/assembly factor-like uncharacterized protein
MYHKNFVLLLAAASILLATATPAFAQNWAYHVVLPQRNQATNADGLVWVLSSVACSADGTKIVAAASGSTTSAYYDSGGLVCVSTDLGATWQAATLPTNSWSGVASSADGTKMVAVAREGSTNANDMTLYTSLDTGASWTPHNAVPYSGPGYFTDWNCVASSADGTKLAAGIEEFDYIGTQGTTNSPGLYSGIALSTDSGATWQPSSLRGIWSTVASSADGSTLAAVGYTNENSPTAVYVSTDGGGGWQQADLPDQFLTFVTVSGDGSTMVATGTNVFTSRDSGAIWMEWTNAPQGPYGPIFWTAPAASADGTKLMVGAFGGGSPGTIYTSDDSGVTWESTNNAFSGAGFLYASASSADGRELVALPRGGSYVFTLDFPQPGHVYCACNSNAIAGATVQIGTNLVTCDNSGAYTIGNVAPGTYTVTITASNYETLTNNLTVSPNQPVTNNFYLTNSALFIDAIYDPVLQALPGFDTISNTIGLACQVLSQNIANPLCVRIIFMSTGTGLGASTTHLGMIPCSQYLDDLKANTNMSANDIQALSTLPLGPGTGLNGNSLVQLTPANLEAIGETALANAVLDAHGGVDSTIALNFGILNFTRPGLNPANYDLQSTAAHEIDEVLGIGGNGSTLDLLNGNSGPGQTNGVGPLDLYRYVSPGFRSFIYSPTVAPYLSIDGGATMLVHFNQYGYGSDYGDWGNGANPAVQADNNPPQVQDAYGTPGEMFNLGPNEFIALDIVGYTLSGTAQIQGLTYSADTFTFNVSTLPGKTYQVQYSTNLAQGSWRDLNGPMVATGMTTTVTDTNATGGQRYYRIIVVSPPQSLARQLPRDKARVGTVVPEAVTHRYLPRKP